MTAGNESQMEFILPAPRMLRDAIDIVYYHFEPRSDARSALIKGFDSKNSEVATLEAQQLTDGSFRIACTRGGASVTIAFSFTRNPSMLEGYIDGQQFRIDSDSKSSIKVVFTDAQRHVMQAWNGASDSFIGLGEAITARSDFPSLGCIAGGVGVGVAAFGCIDGILPACAAGLFGLAYLSDHCI